MNEQVDVKRIPEDGRNGVPEQPLFRLVVRAGELDPDHAERAEPFQDPAHVRIDRKCRSVEGAHHHARGALGPISGRPLRNSRTSSSLHAVSAQACIGRSDRLARRERSLRLCAFLPPETREADGLLDRRRSSAAASCSQVAIPGLERVEGGLVCALAGTPGQDDVDELVHRIRLVAEIGCSLAVRASTPVMARSSAPRLSRALGEATRPSLTAGCLRTRSLLPPQPRPVLAAITHDERCVASSGTIAVPARALSGVSGAWYLGVSRL